MRRDRAHDEAVLRLLGVRHSIRAAATRLELTISAIIAAGTVLVCGVLGVAGFLSRSRLLDLPANQPPVEAGLGSGAVAIVLLVVAAAACAVVVLVGYLARRTAGSRTDPMLLCDGATG
jgi:formate hydrogenlyase subunit 3/multisubunit Na+/H+ antiporter MnhD subunit